MPLGFGVPFIGHTFKQRTLIYGTPCNLMRLIVRKIRHLFKPQSCVFRCKSSLNNELHFVPLMFCYYKTQNVPVENEHIHTSTTYLKKLVDYFLKKIK